MLVDVGRGTPGRKETDSDNLRRPRTSSCQVRPRGRCSCQHASLMAALLLVLLGALEHQTAVPPKRGHIRLQRSPGSWHVSHCAHTWVEYECTLCACVVCIHVYTCACEWEGLERRLVCRAGDGLGLAPELSADWHQCLRRSAGGEREPP